MRKQPIPDRIGEATIRPGPCESCRTIPLSHLALDLLKPLSGWESMLAANGVEVVDDDLGRPAIAREDARQIFEERREREIRLVEEAQRRTEEAKRKTRPTPLGIRPPMGTTASALAVMMAHDQEDRR